MKVGGKMAFGVCDNCYGYEVLRLTDKECEEKGLSTPCYSVFRNNVRVHDYFHSFDDFFEWCYDNRKNDILTEIYK